jgi:adenosine deaminase
MQGHPFKLFLDLGFRVTLNTDNRLMSRTTMSAEYEIAVDTFGCSLDDLELISMNGMKSAFAHYEDRCRLIYENVKTGFAALRAEHGLPPRVPYGT